MAKEVQNSQSGELKKTAEDLDEFLSKVTHSWYTTITVSSTALQRLKIWKQEMPTKINSILFV